MSELKDQLAAEAQRHQPGHQPAFDDLVLRRRRRDRRNFAAMASVVVLALTATVGPVLLRQQQSMEATGAAGEVVVTGMLLTVGGPLGASSHGLPGTLWFEAGDGTTTSTTSANDGRFSVNIPPGRYTASGSPAFLESPSPSASPSVEAAPLNGSNGPSAAATTPWCRADAPVIVPAGGLHDVKVLCHMR